MKGRLIIVTGPTASGKTEYAISLARKYSSPVISCDSRQIYKEMTIGTAVPDASQLAAVKHYFIQTVSVTREYTAGRYETDALALIGKLFSEGLDTLVMCGGSGFYIDAVCKGLDSIPDADPELRRSLNERIASEGVESLWMDLRRMDPEAYSTIDLHNPARVLRAVEVCILSGRPFSSFRLKEPKPRDFETEKLVISRPREELYERIDSRVDSMMEKGLLEEVRSLLPYRNYTALQTVGYKELFSYLDGDCSLDEAVSRIKSNTRRYARKQLTWWRRDPQARWVEI